MGVWWTQGEDGHGGLVEATATRTAGYELGLALTEDTKSLAVATFPPAVSGQLDIVSLVMTRLWRTDVACQSPIIYHVMAFRH